MTDWLRFIAVVIGVGFISWLGTYLFDRLMIRIIKQALNEHEQEKLEK